MPEYQFRIGDRVRIARTSSYFGYQPHAEGREIANEEEQRAVGVVVANLSSIKVRWGALNYENSYFSSDLELVQDIISSPVFVLIVKMSKSFEFRKVCFIGEHPVNNIAKYIRDTQSAYTGANIIFMTKEEIKVLCDSIFSVLKKDITGVPDITMLVV
jgi:hypothetical protein